MGESRVKGIPLKIQELYDAGWEVRVDDLPFEERLREVFQAPAFGAQPRMTLVFAKGDDIAIEFTITKSVYHPAAMQLVEDVRLLKERRDVVEPEGFIVLTSDKDGNWADDWDGKYHPTIDSVRESVAGAGFAGGVVDPAFMRVVACYPHSVWPPLEGTTDDA